MIKRIFTILIIAFATPFVLAEEQPSEKEQQCRTDAAMAFQSESWPCEKKKGPAKKKCIEKAQAKLDAAVGKCKEAK